MPAGGAAEAAANPLPCSSCSARHAAGPDFYRGSRRAASAARARAAAGLGYRVALLARRRENLERIAADLGGSERALAIECDCEWISTDADFARFPGLRWRHPLA